MYDNSRVILLIFKQKKSVKCWLIYVYKCERHMHNWILNVNCSKSEAHHSRVTELCAVVTCVWNFPYVTHLAPRILRWVLDFWKICGPRFITWFYIYVGWRKMPLWHTNAYQQSKRADNIWNPPSSLEGTGGPFLRDEADHSPPSSAEA